MLTAPEYVADIFLEFFVGSCTLDENAAPKRKVRLFLLTSRILQATELFYYPERLPMRSSATSPLQERIDTKLFMTTSAVFMGTLGLMGIILPEELLTFFGAAPDPIVVVFTSLAGSLYVGFAMLNWMARDKVIGGIYSRPVAVANFVQFFAVTILLIKNAAGDGHTTLFAAGFVVNAVFASFFGYLLFGKGKACA